MRLRAGLARTERKEKPAKFRVEPHHFGSRPGLDLDKVGQLLDQLEAEEYLKKPSK